jgi:Flp pilus assembly protein TadD
MQIVSLSAKAPSVTNFKMRKMAMTLVIMSLASCMEVTGTARPDAATAVIHYSAGLQLLQQRNYPAAKAELTKAQPFKTGDVRALMALAVASDMLGDYRTSDRAYGELMTRGTDKAMLFNNMGYSYMLRGDLDRAMTYLTEAARQAPDDAAIRNNLVMLRGVMPTR